MKLLLSNLTLSENIKNISNLELLTLSSISPKKTGIENVFIWVGYNPHDSSRRIKVSNVANKFSKSDCFVITIPDLDIIGVVNTKLIDSKKLNKIKDFVIKNMDLIIQFSDEKISTDEFIDNLQMV